MNSKVLFLVGCIPARIILALTAYKLDTKYLKYLSIFLFCISISFLYLFFTKSRLKAPEAGGETWWHQYRLIHGLLYLTAAIYAFREERVAYIPLIIDLIFGLTIFTYYRLI